MEAAIVDLARNPGRAKPCASRMQPERPTFCGMQGRRGSVSHIGVQPDQRQYLARPADVAS